MERIGGAGLSVIDASICIHDLSNSRRPAGEIAAASAIKLRLVPHSGWACVLVIDNQSPKEMLRPLSLTCEAFGAHCKCRNDLEFPSAVRALSRCEHPHLARFQQPVIMVLHSLGHAHGRGPSG